MTLALITGAPGWIATRLVRALLAQKRPVRCLVLPSQDVSSLSRRDGPAIVRGDLRSAESVREFCRNGEGTTLFHCAGVVHPARFTRELYQVNVLGTRTLLQAAEEAGVKRAIVLSSNSPAGCNPRCDHRFDEGAPYHPYMAYGRSKMLMEQEVRRFQARGRLQAVVLRPTWFYGPDQPLRQTTFFRMIRSGRAPILGNGENLRSMTYVDNLCQAMLLSEANAGAAGETFWISDRHPYSMNQIVATVERLMETEFALPVAHKRLRLPAVAGEVAQAADGFIQALGLYQQKIHVLSEMNKTIACSIDKAERVLGYDPAIELEEGMRRSLAWCLENGIAL